MYKRKDMLHFNIHSWIAGTLPLQNILTKTRYISFLVQKLQCLTTIFHKKTSKCFQLLNKRENDNQ